MIKKIYHSNATETIVEIRNVTKSFDDKEVLCGVDIDLHRGENVVILGRSGVGKSVLIKIIVGLLAQDSGSVKVLGKEVNELSKRELQELRLKIGFSFQSSALYDSMTVGENLAFPLSRHRHGLSKNKRQQIIYEALEAVGLEDFGEQLPAELSGGQKKRVGIARTLIMNPQIMLYDEPTAGLDPVTSMEINELINNVQEKYNTSSLIITHDLTCAKITGDRIVMMENGRFIKRGSFEDVFNTADATIKSFYDYNFIQ